MVKYMAAALPIEPLEILCLDYLLTTDVLINSAQLPLSIRARIFARKDIPIDDSDRSNRLRELKAYWRLIDSPLVSHPPEIWEPIDQESRQALLAGDPSHDEFLEIAFEAFVTLPIPNLGNFSIVASLIPILRSDNLRTLVISDRKSFPTYEERCQRTSAVPIRTICEMKTLENLQLSNLGFQYPCAVMDSILSHLPNLRRLEVSGSMWIGSFAVADDDLYTLKTRTLKKGVNLLFGVSERPLDFLGIVQYRFLEVESLCLECAVDNAEVPNHGPVIPFAKRYTASWNNTRFFDSANYYSKFRGVAFTLLDLSSPHDVLALNEYRNHGIFVNPSRYIAYQHLVLQACYHKIYRNHQPYGVGGLLSKLYLPFIPLKLFTDRFTFQSAPYAVLLDMVVEILFKNESFSGIFTFDFLVLLVHDALIMWPEVLCIPSEKTYNLAMEQIYKKGTEDLDRFLSYVLAHFQRVADASAVFRQMVVRWGFVENFEKMYGTATEEDVKKGLLGILINILYHCDIKISDDTATRLAEVILSDKESENCFVAQSVVNCLVQLMKFMNSYKDSQNNTVATILEATQNVRGAHWHGSRSVKMYVELLAGETLDTLALYAMNQLEDIIAESGDRVKRLLVLERGVRQLRAIQTCNRRRECIKRADQLLAELSEIAKNFEEL